MVRWLGRLLRRLVRTTLLIAGPLVVGAIGLYLYVGSGRYVTTENAYVKADLIIVAPEISGRVAEVKVADNQIVAPGDVLFRIDPERFDTERARRAAQLANARQMVAGLRARYRTRKAELAAAVADAAFERDELDRSQRLRQSGTISEFRLQDVRRESDRAARSVTVLHEGIAEGLIELGGDPDMPTDQHPDVLQAMAELRQAELNVEAATVRLQVGEYVEAGYPALSLVGTDAIWISANLKETDLTHLDVGQTAELEVDAYPGVTWRATLTSLACDGR